MNDEILFHRSVSYRARAPAFLLLAIPRHLGIQLCLPAIREIILCVRARTHLSPLISHLISRRVLMFGSIYFSPSNPIRVDRKSRGIFQ